MRKSRSISSSFIKTGVLLLAFAAMNCVGAFATLGDGSGKKSVDLVHKSLLSKPVQISGPRYSLSSNYNFRGNQVVNPNRPEQYIKLSPSTTIKQGSTTYVIPLQNNKVLNKVRFNPNSATAARY